MANTLRFTVEVAADQATQALKALSVASNQAGVAMKTSMASVGTSSRVAAGGLMELKASAGKARETAMFFTQALGEFGPQGRTAQIAISGVAGAIMGGGGVLIALGLAQAAIRLLVDAWQEEAKAEAAAKKAAEESAKAQAEAAARRMGVVRDVFESAKKTNDDLKAQLRGLNDQEIADAEEIKKLKREILSLDGAQLAAAKKRLDQVLAIQAENAALRRQLELKKNIKEAEKPTGGDGGEDKDAASIDRLMADREKAYKDGLENLRRVNEKLNADDQAAYNAQVRESAAVAQDWGAALGDVFAQVATGQMEAEDAIKQVGQKIIQQTVQAAIASVTANAASAGSGAAASQAAIPVVGPVLAISAMGAVMSSVLGLLGSMPSARGGWWDTGSYEGLAMIHKKEMVLPAREAEMVRKGAGGVTLNVAAYDARGFDRVLSNNNSALAREMRKMNRRGSM